jgi:hypothetical protein
MTSERKIDANRINASKSTGPKTDSGKRRSRRNAWRHGLTAETIIAVSEDAADYRSFESKIVRDYRPQTAVELELVVRLASLLWRLRRATAVESGLWQIHSEKLNNRDAQVTAGGSQKCQLQIFYDSIPSLNPPFGHNESNDIKRIDIARSFSRFCHIDGDTFDRLGRYETRLWRQLAQTVFLLGQIDKSLREPVLFSNGDLLGFVRGKVR